MGFFFLLMKVARMRLGLSGVHGPGSFFFLEIRHPSVLNPDCNTSSLEYLLYCTGSVPSVPSSLSLAYCTHRDIFPSSLRHVYYTHRDIFLPLHWMTTAAVEAASQPPAKYWVVSPYIPMMKNTDH